MTIAFFRALPLAVLATCLIAAPSKAEPIRNPVAVFSGLDKITGRIITFDAWIDETVQFGALRVTPKACHTRPPTEEPQTEAFVQVDEVTPNATLQRIFTGWMFAASPGLNAVDHPIYDVWLVDCRMDSQVPPPANFPIESYRGDGFDRVTRPDDWVAAPRPKPYTPGSGSTFDENAPVDDAHPED